VIPELCFATLQALPASTLWLHLQATARASKGSARSVRDFRFLLFLPRVVRLVVLAFCHFGQSGGGCEEEFWNFGESLEELMAAGSFGFGIGSESRAARLSLPCALSLVY
jgi:hypothetical protein